MSPASAVLGRDGQWRGSLTYGVAHFGKSLFWYSGELLFAFFLTEFVGLPALQMATVLALGYLVSGVIDIAAGGLLGRRLADARSASRMQLLGAFAASIALAVILIGVWVDEAYRFGFSLAAGLLFRIAYSLYDVPQNMLLALATVDERARIRVAAIRIWFSGAATLVTAAAVGPMVAARTEAVRSLVLPLILVGAFAVIAITSAFCLDRLFRRARADTPFRAPPQRTHRSVSVELRVLFLLMFLTSIFIPLFSKIEPYFAAYVIASPWWGGVIASAVAVGTLTGQPFCIRLCDHWGFARAMLTAAVLQLSALATFWLIAAESPLAAACAALCFGLGHGGLGMIQWAALSQAAARDSSANTGLSFGLYSGLSKIGLAVGSAVLGIVLAGPEAHSAPQLIAMMVSLPAVGAVIACCASIFLMLRQSPLRRALQCA